MYNFLLVLIITFTATTSCNAYLDGGSASMLLQLLLGGVAGGLVFIKIYWNKVKKLFTNKN